MDFNVLVERRVNKQIRGLDEKISGRIAEALDELRKGFSARLDIKKINRQWLNTAVVTSIRSLSL